MRGPSLPSPERTSRNLSDRQTAFLPPPRFGEGGRGGEVTRSPGRQSNLSPQPPSPKRGGGLRTPILFVALFAAPALAADPGPPASKKVTYRGDAVAVTEAARAIREQTTIDVDVSALDAGKKFALDLQNADFWPAVSQLADRTGSKVVTTGGRVALRPGKSLAPVSVGGPFRFTVREVYARIDPETGRSGYEVTLEACWEPWLLAYRMDTTPSVLKVTNDQGREVAVAKNSTRALTVGNIAPLSVRPEATRADKWLTLTGSVRVTIADKLLTFTFDAAKPEAVPAQQGITATVKRHGADGANWFAEVELRHAAGGVPVESHEYALFRNNTLELVSPTGERLKADGTEFDDPATRYVFKNAAKKVGPGWKLEYRTPGPLREVVVPFELMGIALP